MTDLKDLPESPASVTAKVKTTAGFELLFTLRDQTGADLLKRYDLLERTFADRGWTPVPNGFGKAVVGQPSATKECPIHSVAMTEKKGQYGPFYSHKLGEHTDGTPIWCNGEKKKYPATLESIDPTDSF